MHIIDDPIQISKEIDALKRQGKYIGFVPTMGALHEGHLRLLRKAGRQNHSVVSSIFVNPSQFNVKEDLKNYPRPIEKDIELLESVGCDFLFKPDANQIYPSGYNYNLDIDLMGLDIPMEGKFRPGHFKGVVQVVKRLLEIVNPDKLYMGLKDFQQFTIIQHLINQLKLPVILIGCKTKREADGLAMSSRNQRLEPKLRKEANIIRKTLLASKRRLSYDSPKAVQKYALNRLKIPGFNPEYFEIVDGSTLKQVQKLSEHNFIVACTAVWAGEVRLIDNIICKNPK